MRLDGEGGGRGDAVGDAPYELDPEAQVRGLVQEDRHVRLLACRGISRGSACSHPSYVLRSLILPALSGVLYFLSWIGFGIWPLAFICFVPQVFALRDASGKEALRR